jgi:ribonuclease HI
VTKKLHSLYTEIRFSSINHDWKHNEFNATKATYKKDKVHQNTKHFYERNYSTFIQKNSGKSGNESCAEKAKFPISYSETVENEGINNQCVSLVKSD